MSSIYPFQSKEVYILVRVCSIKKYNEVVVGNTIHTIPLTGFFCLRY